MQKDELSTRRKRRVEMREKGREGERSIYRERQMGMKEREKSIYVQRDR